MVAHSLLSAIESSEMNTAYAIFFQSKGISRLQVFVSWPQFQETLTLFLDNDNELTSVNTVSSHLICYKSRNISAVI